MLKAVGLNIGALILVCCACAADTLVLRDGSTHSGRFVSATTGTVSFSEAGTVQRYARSKIQSIEFDNSTVASPLQEGGTSRLGRNSRSSVVLPAGTEISVLTNESIDSKAAQEGQVFPADVAEDVTNSAGTVVIPKGSEAELVIRRIASAGTVTGSSDLTLDLQSIKVGGRRYRVSTEDIEQSGRAGLGKNKRTAEMVGGGAVLGTLIGAIAGGGKGAAIGAAGGAAAGAGTQVLTRGKAVQVPAESRLRFKLDRPLRLESAY